MGRVWGGYGEGRGGVRGGWGGGRGRVGRGRAGLLHSSRRVYPLKGSSARRSATEIRSSSVAFSEKLRMDMKNPVRYTKLGVGHTGKNGK